MRCCARWSRTTCCAGERAELHLALARALEERSPGAQIAVGIAHHYAAAGDQPSALASGVRAAGAAEAIHAYGEAAALFERVLQLWDRVPEAEALAGCDRVAVLQRAADAHLMAGETARPEALLGRRSGSSTGRPTRCARRRARADRAGAVAAGPQQGLAGVGARGVVARRVRPSVERAGIVGWWAKSVMLQGKFSEAVSAAREAIEVAEAVGNDAALSAGLNALGVALARQGRWTRGRTRCNGRSRSPASGTALPSSRARRSTWPTRCTSRAAAARRWTSRAAGLADASLRGYRPDWLAAVIGEILIDLGEWEEAASMLAAPAALPGSCSSTSSCGGPSCARARRARCGGRAPAGAGRASSRRRPSRSGTRRTGRCVAELRRREGDLDAAATAVDDALDRIEFCTEDAMRLAQVSAVGVAVEADRAQRGRDLGDSAEVRRALMSRDLLLGRVEAAASLGMPVEEAWLRTASADSARADGADDPALWDAAAAAWEALARPTRGAGPLAVGGGSAAAGDRDTAPRARIRLGVAACLGAGWLVGEATGLADRARLRLDAERADPAPPSAPADGRSVRPHPPRAPGPRPGRPRRDEPRDRSGALHRGEDRQRPRLPHPRQARRANPNPGGGDRPPPRPHLLDPSPQYGLTSRTRPRNMNKTRPPNMKRTRPPNMKRPVPSI